MLAAVLHTARIGMKNMRCAAQLVLIGFIAIALTVLDLLREPVFPGFGEIAIGVADKMILLVGMAGVAWAVQGHEHPPASMSSIRFAPSMASDPG